MDTIDERKVEANIKLLRSLPSQFIVRNWLWSDTYHLIIVVTCLIKTASCIPVNILVTYGTIRCTKGSICYNWIILQEAFTRKTPLSTYRPEITPTVICTKNRRTITTIRCRRIVLVLIRIVNISKIRSQTSLLFIEFRVTPWTYCRQISHTRRCEWEILSIHILIVVWLFLHFLSYHCWKVMHIIESFVPANNIIPGKSCCTRIILLSQSIILYTLWIIKSWPILILAIVRNVCTKIGTIVDTIPNINLNIWIQVKCLILTLIDITKFFISQGQWIIIFRLTERCTIICTILIIERTERIHKGNCRNSSVRHRTTCRLAETILYSISIVCISTYGKTANFTLYVGTTRVALVIWTQNNTLCIKITSTNIETCIASFSLSTDIIILIVAIASNSIHPIIRRSAIPAITICQFSLCCFKISSTTCCNPSLSKEIHSLLGIGIVHIVVTHVWESLLNIQVNIKLALRAFLGCDNNHTIRRTRTIDSSCRSILQYSYVLNVFRIDRSHWVNVIVGCSTHTIGIWWYRHAINDIQRLSTRIERTTTTYINSAPCTRLTTRVIHLYTRHITLKSLNKVCVALFLNLSTIQQRSCTSKRGFLLDTITSYNHLIKGLLVCT